MNNNDNKVKRYSLGLTITTDYSGFSYSEPLIYESPNGDYVHINDYNKLESKWQPIETAPKNKVFFIYGINIYKNKSEMDYGWYDKNLKCYVISDGYGSHSEIKATHWMPLPKPPQN